MSVHAPCPVCGHPIIVGMFDTIKVKELGEDGKPLMDTRGKPIYTVHKLRRHVCQWPFTPRGGTKADIPYPTISKLDPSGLVETLCHHGLPAHPVTGAKPLLGNSWMRSKYVLTGLKPCPVCRDLPAPADMLAPRGEGIMFEPLVTG